MEAEAERVRGRERAVVRFDRGLARHLASVMPAAAARRRARAVVGAALAMRVARPLAGGRRGLEEDERREVLERRAVGREH